MSIIKEKNNTGYVRDVSLTEMIKKYGSPLYIYDEETILNSYRELKNCFTYPDIRIHYAMKANSNSYILKILKEEGAGIDAVSKEEVLLALKIGYKPEDIIFTAINLTDDDLSFAYENKILLNIGSLYTLERYGMRHPGAEISIRINPKVGAGHHDHVITAGYHSKFGIFEDDIPIAKEIIRKYNLNLTGIHCHIGSGILEINKYLEVMDIILNEALKFENLRFIDFGGGFGVPYHENQKPLDLVKLGALVSEKFDKFCKKVNYKPHIIFEPGRYIVAKSGVLLVSVVDLKKTQKYTFAGVDSGFNHLIRPMAYGSYHEIVNISNMNAKKHRYVIAGYLCESGDVFTRDEKGILERDIEEIRVGDILAILNAGAYGYSMSSNYNMRLRPAEVMIRNSTDFLIRKRENFEDLVKNLIY